MARPEPRRHMGGPHDSAYVVAELPGGKDLGAIATRAIRKGETLLTEKPLVRLTPNIGCPIEKYFGEKSEVRAKLARLSRCAGPPLEYTWWDPDLDAVCNTNSFTLASGGSVHSYVFLNLSRLNHSCDPNSVMVFNGDSEVACLRATRDIPRGTELCINYGADGEVGERRAHLRKCFGFICMCELCKHEERHKGRAPTARAGQPAEHDDDGLRQPARHTLDPSRQGFGPGINSNRQQQQARAGNATGPSSRRCQA